MTEITDWLKALRTRLDRMDRTCRCTQLKCESCDANDEFDASSPSDLDHAHKLLTVAVGVVASLENYWSKYQIVGKAGEQVSESIKEWHQAVREVGG